jgi:hypothetical protein
MTQARQSLNNNLCLLSIAFIQSVDQDVEISEILPGAMNDPKGVFYLQRALSSQHQPVVVSLYLRPLFQHSLDDESKYSLQALRFFLISERKVDCYNESVGVRYLSSQVMFHNSAHACFAATWSSTQQERHVPVVVSKPLSKSLVL